MAHNATEDQRVGTANGSSLLQAQGPEFYTEFLSTAESKQIVIEIKSGRQMVPPYVKFLIYVKGQVYNRFKTR